MALILEQVSTSWHEWARVEVVVLCETQHVCCVDVLDIWLTFRRLSEYWESDSAVSRASL